MHAGLFTDFKKTRANPSIGIICALAASLVEVGMCKLDESILSWHI